MKANILTSIVLMMTALLLIVSIPGTVSADNEPNDSFPTAEEIEEGTHTGSLYQSDNLDWYKVMVGVGIEVKVEAKIIDPGMMDQVTIKSCDTAGIPDGQIEIIVDTGKEADSCYWTHDNEVNTYLYIRVQGVGNYQMKLIFGDSAKKIIDDIADECCFGTVSIGFVSLISIIAVLILIKRKRGI